MLDSVLTTSAPGKVILLGEHAVVYPNHSAVIMPMPGVSCTVKIVPMGDDDSHIRVVEKAARLDCVFSMTELQDCLVQSKENYQKFLQNADMKYLESYKKPAQYIKLIMALVSEYLRQQDVSIRPAKLQLDSTIPVGGMGSSAAVAASLIQAFVKHHGASINQDKHYELTLNAERFQHGKPSGGDPAAIVYNQPVCLSKKLSGSDIVSKLKSNVIPPELLQNCYVLYTGRPAQSTGELIACVQKKYNQDPAVVEALEANTQEFLNLIKDRILNEQTFLKIINANGILLEKLGVVTDLGLTISQLIRQAGGAAKVSGAGGLGKGPCGAMFIYLNNRAVLQELGGDYTIYPMIVTGKEG